jgi:hypothetical protein
MNCPTAQRWKKTLRPHLQYAKQDPQIQLVSIKKKLCPQRKNIHFHRTFLDLYQLLRDIDLMLTFGKIPLMTFLLLSLPTLVSLVTYNFSACRLRTTSSE